MSERLTDFRQLNVWQKAHQLVINTYEMTKKFPKDEKTELVSKIRTAAMTVPMKIAEGFIRRTPKEKETAYKASQVALEDLKYYIILSTDLEYYKDSEEMLSSIEEVGRMLIGLVRSAKG